MKEVYAVNIVAFIHGAMVSFIAAVASFGLP